MPTVPRAGVAQRPQTQAGALEVPGLQRRMEWSVPNK